LHGKGLAFLDRVSGGLGHVSRTRSTLHGHDSRLVDSSASRRAGVFDGHDRAIVTAILFFGSVGIQQYPCSARVRHIGTTQKQIRGCCKIRDV
jgi:hypothetical protein